MGSLLLQPGGEPKFSQLYIVDTSMALKTCMDVFWSLDSRMMSEL